MVSRNCAGGLIRRVRSIEAQPRTATNWVLLRIRCVPEPLWASRVTSALSFNAAHDRYTRCAYGAGTKVVDCQNIMGNIDGTIGSPGSCP